MKIQILPLAPAICAEVLQSLHQFSLYGAVSHSDSLLVICRYWYRARTRWKQETCARTSLRVITILRVRSKVRGTLGPGLNVGLSAGVTYLYQTESSSGFHRVHSEM